jgi:hypothetical protein
MKSILKTAGLLGALTLVGAATIPASAAKKPSVSVAAGGAVVQRGKTTWVAVRVTIPRPYHANSNPASQSFLIPTSVSLASAPGVRAGSARYPKGVMKKFTFSDKPISVYEGTIVARVPVSVAASAKPGVRNLSGTVRYQACDDKNCYAPTNVRFSAPLRVK